MLDKTTYQKGKEIYVKNEDGSFKQVNSQELMDLKFNQQYADLRKPLPENANIISSMIQEEAPEIEEEPEALEEEIETGLGKKRVNYLFKLYANRDATPEELEIYSDDEDEDKIRKDLEIVKGNIKPPRVNKIKGTGEETPFFRGDSALVRFAEDPDGDGPQTTETIWYVDKTNKVLRPILSEEAFNNFFNEDLNTVEEKGGITTLPMSAMTGTFKEFRLLEDKYGIKEDGSFEEPEYNKFNVESNDGQGGPADSTANSYSTTKNASLEKTVTGYLENILYMIQSNSDSGISADTVSKIINSPEVLSQYVAATTYGGYSLNDIVRDIKRRQLVSEGRTDLNNIKVIDSSLKANDYYGTKDGVNANATSDISAPRWLGSVDMSIFNNTVFNLPDEAFKTLVKPLDITTPEGKAEIEKIQSVYHDVLTKQIEAKSKAEKAVADADFNRFNELLDRKYNIQLSDNANTAFNQISQLGESGVARGIYDSGIMNEIEDKYLQSVRKTNDRLRDQKLTEEEDAERTYLMNYGTPEQIAALSQEKKTAYGLMPDTETSAFFNMDNLKKQYPNVPAETLQMYRDLLFDASGSFKSNLYKTLGQNKFLVQEGYSFGSLPDGGKKEFQETTAMNKYLNEEEKKAKEFTSGANLGSKVNIGSNIKTTPTETSSNDIKPFEGETKQPWEKTQPDVSGSLIKEEDTIRPFQGEETQESIKKRAGAYISPTIIPKVSKTKTIDDWMNSGSSLSYDEWKNK